MWFFRRRKKKTQLFGNNVEPKCEYCNYNCGDEDISCALNQSPENGFCKKYEYNPLMRKPKTQTLFNNDFTEDDFKL